MLPLFSQMYLQPLLILTSVCTETLFGMLAPQILPLRARCNRTYSSARLHNSYSMLNQMEFLFHIVCNTYKFSLDVTCRCFLKMLIRQDYFRAIVAEIKPYGSPVVILTSFLFSRPKLCRMNGIRCSLGMVNEISLM